MYSAASIAVLIMIHISQDCSATHKKCRHSMPKGVALPSAIDWRDRNVITPVKNQVL